MKQKLLVIKLGGAVVTFKDSQIPKARISTIKRLAKEIKQISDQGYQIILVHGAGSFAHGLVKKYGIDKGMQTKQQREAFKLTQKRMLQLNKIIMDNLTQAGLASVSLPPHTFVTQNKGNLYKFNPKRVKKYLDKNEIPVLFGDMVSDKSWGCSVLSGDTIVCYLGKKFKADKVIFLSDVDGIFDADPKKNPQAKLILEITSENINQVLKYLSPTKRDDVTGEMQGKIQEIKEWLSSVTVLIANGLKPGSLLKALGQYRVGTKLHLE